MPTPPSPADRRFRELCNDYAAVARLELVGVGTSLLARDTSGEPGALEVLDADGKPLELRAALELLALCRSALVRSAEQATDHLIAGLALRIKAGEDVNLAAFARDAGLARQTLYNRLGELGVNPA